MINNNPQNFEGDINYLIIEYLKNQKFKSNSEKEEIITKVYFLFFKFLNFSLQAIYLMVIIQIYP